MSTFAHVMSFPFFFFGVIFLIATFTNSLTLHFGSMKRKAMPLERVAIFGISVVVLLFALFLVTR